MSRDAAVADSEGLSAAQTPGDQEMEKERHRHVFVQNASSKSTEEGLHLKRQLGLFHGVAIISGLVIGGGIYISPKGVVQFAGSPGLSLVLWGVGGLLSMLGALTYAEIGIVMPVAGEKYAYLEELYGPFLAFCYLWLYLFFIRTGGNAVKALMFGRYVLKPFFPDCEIPQTAILLIATAMAGNAANNMHVFSQQVIKRCSVEGGSRQLSLIRGQFEPKHSNPRHQR